ncbi:hypothetical protein SpCBS45565_g08381 [Spizellomyces sp. 'palustris']|nr:hypothetical protein SpCBS45565_g08381 [Spizellomyces sp. 'palustris']
MTHSYALDSHHASDQHFAELEASDIGAQFDGLSSVHSEHVPSPHSPHESLPHSPSVAHLVASPVRLASDGVDHTANTDLQLKQETRQNGDPSQQQQQHQHQEQQHPPHHHQQQQPDLKLEGPYLSDVIPSTLTMQSLPHMGEPSLHPSHPHQHAHPQHDPTSTFSPFAAPTSTHMHSPALQTHRTGRARAQTFHFGSPANVTYSPMSTYAPLTQQVYSFPYSSGRFQYQGMSQSMSPLATVPEHPLPPISSTQQLSPHEHMFTFPPPPLSDSDRPVLQFRHQQQQHFFHDAQQRMRRSPPAMTRQRSSSDQVMRPSTLLVDTGMARRPSAMSYNGAMVSPLGTPTPDPYDGHMSVSAEAIMMGGHMGSLGDTLGQSMSYGTGYLNPAHLSQPHTRRRAPSAPLIPHPSYFHTPVASPSESSSPHDSPQMLHYSTDPSSTPIMNPVDEDFKRRILQLKFEEREIAIDFLKDQAKQAGFSVLVRTSRPDYVVIICNCGRRVKQVEGERKRKRKRKTAMTGCEWHVILFRRNIPGSTVPRMWEFRASSKMEHNHPLNLNDD